MVIKVCYLIENKLLNGNKSLLTYRKWGTWGTAQHMGHSTTHGAQHNTWGTAQHMGHSTTHGAQHNTWAQHNT